MLECSFLHTVGCSKQAWRSQRCMDHCHQVCLSDKMWHSLLAGYLRPLLSEHPTPVMNAWGTARLMTNLTVSEQTTLMEDDAMVVAIFSKCFPLPTDITAVFSRFVFSHLSFIKRRDSWKMVLLASEEKEIYVLLTSGKFPQT